MAVNNNMVAIPILADKAGSNTPLNILRLNKEIVDVANRTVNGFI